MGFGAKPSTKPLWFRYQGLGFKANRGFGAGIGFGASAYGANHNLHHRNCWCIALHICVLNLQHRLCS